jgi:hypothetical protein
VAAASQAARASGGLRKAQQIPILLGMPKTLHEQINDVVVFYVEEKLRTNTPVDVAAIAREITQSLVDMIMEQDEQNRRRSLPR